MRSECTWTLFNHLSSQRPLWERQQRRHRPSLIEGRVSQTWDPCPRGCPLSCLPLLLWLRILCSLFLKHDSELLFLTVILLNERQKQSNILALFTRGANSSLCLPPLEKEGFCFIKHQARMVHNPIGSHLWFVLFSLLSEETATECVSSVKESRGDVQSCGRRAARVLSPPCCCSGPASVWPAVHSALSEGTGGQIKDSAAPGWESGLEAVYPVQTVQWLFDSVRCIAVFAKQPSLYALRTPDPSWSANPISLFQTVWKN